MYISSELKELVFHSVKLLGDAIKEIYGDTLFQEIEELRLKMKSVRNAESQVVQQALEETYLNLSRKNSQDLHQTAKAFSLMLEVINSCEAAYRVQRLKSFKLDITKAPYALVYVFTSHPTEARSRPFLSIMDKVEQLLGQAILNGFDEVQGQLLHLFKIAVRINLANNKRPQVKDEAEQIFHTVLDHKVIAEQIYLRQKGVDVFFRTWVGGDKDGHPGVGPETLVQSLTLSRIKLLSYISNNFSSFNQELKLLGSDKEISANLKALMKILSTAKKVDSGDGKKVALFRKKFETFFQKVEAKHLMSPAIQEIKDILWLYPALVMPLEVREDSELIHEALVNNKLAIAQMLGLIKKISPGMDAKWYVRGFIISMCQTSEDLLAAANLTKKMMGSYAIPVVPLFENEKGLTGASHILSKSFSKFPFVKEHESKWGSRFEVMLGYSDSSKENGVLPGRLLVERALLKIDKFILSKKLIPVFFHGSGGSVSRGGGSVKEQVAWWPQTALNIYKVTIQGETVQRNFHQPLVLRSQVGKITEEYANFSEQKSLQSPVMESFSSSIQDAYRNLVSDPAFQELVTQATPYEFLNLLRIGSRPTKRSGQGKFTLRAIPWILCWTQTRLLLPIWWGTGSAWSNLSKEEKEKLREYHEHSPLFQSYIKHLGYTLAKIELGVWKFHVAHSHLTDEEKNSWNDLIENELLKTIKFFNEMTGNRAYTWYRPWLGESIYFRSSMIHPLNIIQKLALERDDHVLLRETVTGIACGMLTTG